MKYFCLHTFTNGDAANDPGHRLKRYYEWIFTVNFFCSVVYETGTKTFFILGNLPIKFGTTWLRRKIFYARCLRRSSKLYIVVFRAGEEDCWEIIATGTSINFLFPSVPLATICKNELPYLLIYPLELFVDNSRRWKNTIIHQLPRRSSSPPRLAHIMG